VRQPSSIFANFYEADDCNVNQQNVAYEHIASRHDDFAAQMSEIAHYFLVQPIAAM
jgi:hypothetical protein